ncbi:MAG: leucyl aminopeptidase, partial [Methylobacteriaceae bacterium]|nr:leucyl aminopeptidase [Methylobacteriaceae bacterium]
MDRIAIDFQPLAMPKSGDLVVLVDAELKVLSAPGDAARLTDLVSRAAAAERFKGKWQSALTIPAPDGLGGIDRLLAVG